MEETRTNWREHIAPGLGITVLGALLLLFALALAVSIFYTISGEKEILRQQMDSQGNSLAQASAIFATESLLIEDYPVLSTYTEGLLRHYPDLNYILIKRVDQKVVANSSRPMDKPTNVSRYFSNVVVDEDLIGRIEIAISTANYDAFVADHLQKMVIQSVIIFLALAFSLFVFFRKMITDPLHHLVDQAKHLSKGGLNHSIEVEAKGELRQLATVLNSMRISLKESYDDITEQNRFLDHRVAERTKELRDANAKLVETHSQLLQSEKMAAIGQLSAGVAHEINNPIGFVSSNVSVLSDWCQSLIKLIKSYDQSAQGSDSIMSEINAHKQEIDFDYIKEEIPQLMLETIDGLNRVATIVGDLKNFAHVDDMAWQQADLHEGINSTLNIVKNEVKYKAEVELKFDAIPLVECLPSQINQVFMNLIVNAAQSIEKKGLITIKTESLESWVCISISDTGKGIPDSDLDRILEPFYTTKPVGMGTGLGLSVSYGIIKAHHGRIEVESELGKGTTFHLWLPAKQPEDVDKD